MRRCARLWREFRSGFNYWTYCKFWGCEPPQDGSWWVNGRGLAIITPATKNYCGHCKRVIPL